MKDFRFSNHFFAFAAPLLIVAVLQIGVCVPIDVDPETAVNQAGTSHTVVATLEDPDPNLEWLAFFIVFFGPNEGQNSAVECPGALDDCIDELADCFNDPFGPACSMDCTPSGCFAPGDESISWTYESNGDTGTDFIAVCAATEEIDVFSFVSFLQLAISQQVGVQQLIPEEDLDEIIAELEALGCEVVTKDWVELPDLTITKTCLGDGDGDADFNILVTQLDETVAVGALDCGEDLLLADLEPGSYTIRELITGPDANNFETSISCTSGDVTTVTPGDLASVSLELGVDTVCEILNTFNDPDAPVDPSPTPEPGIDIDNTNTNALNNDNLNTNNNENTNTQEQSNFQEQINDNNQTTTVNSSPSVVIDFE